MMPHTQRETARKPPRKEGAKPYLKVTWESPAGSGHADANCFDEKLRPWVIKAQQQGTKTTVYVVRNGDYLNPVGIRA